MKYINLFSPVSLIRSAMQEARRIKPVEERVAIKIQKEIDYAAEHGRGEVIVHTGDFYLSEDSRCTINQELVKAGYKYKWRFCGEEEERVHIWWEDSL